MKTLCALFAGLLFTAASFAADRRPTVTVNANRNYEIVIDGRKYYGDNTINLSHLRNGTHNIRVYEISRGFFRNKARLVSASTFRLWDNDLYINIDRFGNVQIRESRYGNGRGYRRDDNTWNDRDRNDRDQNNRDWNDRDRDNKGWNERNERRY